MFTVAFASVPAAVALAFAVVLVSGLFAAPAFAHPAYQAQIPNGDRVQRHGTWWPGVGHVAPGGGGNAENSFGDAFAAAGHTWSTALCNADTDGDGFTNGVELGDPACLWTTGALPERLAGITHPGYADSYPTTLTASFKLVGPAPHEGVLQGRVYPKPWGAVNFGFTSSDWAREYCAKSGRLDDARLARAWLMRDRPASDLQYLPPQQYVSISEPVGCQATDMMRCSPSYSDPNAPQNTSQAHTDAIYVDCKYNAATGIAADYLPARLISPDAGMGKLEVLVKEADGTSAWRNASTEAPAFPFADSFVCNRLLNFPTTSFNSVVERDALDRVPYELLVVPPHPSEDLVNGSLLFGSVSHYNATYRCAAPPPAVHPAGAFNGPSTIEVVAAVDLSVLATQAAFEALIASTYGVTGGDISVRVWNASTAMQLAHTSVHVRSTTANPNAAVTRIAGDDASTFGVLAARFERVPDPTAAPAAPPTDIIIDGPSATEGVVKARYSGGDPYGLVAWDTAQAWAEAFCIAAGQPPGAFLPRLQYLSDVPGATAYIPADYYVAWSDPANCNDIGDFSSCNWVYSPPGTPRNATGPDRALWVDCQFSAYPKVRLFGPRPCIGVLQAKLPGTSEWLSAWTDFSVPDLCRLAGCPCYEEGNAGCKADNTVNFGTKPMDYFLHTCDLDGPLNACTITTHDPPQNYGPLNGFACKIYPDTTQFVGQKTFKLAMAVNYTTTQQEILDGILQWFPSGTAALPYSWLRFDEWHVNETTEMTHFVLATDRRGADEQLAGSVHHWVSYIPGNFDTNPWPHPLNTYSAKEVHPQEDPLPGELEFRLGGDPSKPYEGFVEARLPDKAWGGIFMGTGTHESTLWADSWCTQLGLYRPDRQAVIYGRDQRWGLRPGVSTFWSTTYQISIGRYECPLLVDQRVPPTNFSDACNYRYIDPTYPPYWNNHHTGLAQPNYAIYIACADEPHQVRVASEVPGIGVLEIKWNGVWEPLRDSVSAEAVCNALLGFPVVAGWTPTRSVFTMPTSKKILLRSMDTSVPSIKGANFEYVPVNGHPNTFECVEPPSTAGFGVTSLQRMLAAMPLGQVTRAQLIATAATVAGIPQSEVSVWEWSERPDVELIYFSLFLNNTGINTAVALANIAADGSLGILHQSIAAVPLASEILPNAWSWTLETPPGDAGMPSRKRGNVVTRPSSHYPWGVPCAATWTADLTNTICATVFGAGVLGTGATAATFEVIGVAQGAQRQMYLEDVTCAANAVDITTCSYAYTPQPTGTCPGTQNIFVDCAPASETRTMTASMSPSVTRSLEHTTTATLAPTVSVELPTPAPTPAPPTPPVTAAPPTPAPTTTTAAPTTTAGPSTTTTAAPAPATTTTSSATSPPGSTTAVVAALPTTTAAPTPVPTHPAPQCVASASVSAMAALLRPGTVVNVTVYGLVAHATANASASVPPRLRLTVDLLGGLRVPSSCVAPLPPRCVAATAAVNVTQFVCEDTFASFNGVPLTVAVAAPVPAWAAAASVRVTVSLTGYTAGIVEAAAYPTPPAPSVASATVPLVHNSGGSVQVSSAVPPLNQLIFGSELRLGGNERFGAWLPAAVAVGPWVVAASPVAASGALATLQLPTAQEGVALAEAVRGLLAVNATTTDVIDATSAAVEGAFDAILRSQHGPAAVKHIVCDVLSSASRRQILATAVALLRKEQALRNATTLLNASTAKADDNDWLAVELLRHARPEWHTAQVHMAPVLMSAPEPAFDDTIVTPVIDPTVHGSPQVSLANLTEFVPGATGSVSPNATIRIVAMVPSTLVNGTATTVPDSNRSVVVTGPTSQRPATDANGTRIGTWVTFTVPTASNTSGVWRDVFGPPTTTTAHVEATATAPASVVVVSGPTSVTLRLEVTDPASTTTTLTERLITLPTLAVRVLASSRPYSCTLHVYVGSAERVAGVRLLAFPRDDLSARAYPVRAVRIATGAQRGRRRRRQEVGGNRTTDTVTAPTSSTTSSCAYDATNASASCQASELWRRAQPALLQVELTAQAPSYFEAPVVASVHIGGVSVPGFEMLVTLGRDPASNVTVVTAGGAPTGDGGGEAADGSGNTSATDTAPPTTTSRPSQLAPTTAAPASLGQAMMRGVFGLSAGCDGALIGFLPATTAAFVVLLVSRIVASAVLRRRGGRNEEDRHDTTAASGIRAAVSLHCYAGAAVPCHHYCGPVHAVALYVHLLVLYAVAATLVNAYRGGMLESTSGMFALAGLTALVGAIVQPVVALPFTMYRLIDTRVKYLGRRGPASGYRPHDLADYRAKDAMVGVANRTMDAMSDLEYGATLASTPSDDNTAWRVSDIDTAYNVNGTGVGNTSDGGQTGGESPASQKAHSPALAALGPGSGSPRVPRDLGDGPAPSAGQTTPDSSDLPSQDNVRAHRVAHPLDRPARSERDSVVVDSRRYAIAGFGAAAVLAVALIMTVAAATADWCAPELTAFRDVMLLAFAFDLVGAQALLIALSFCWRWLQDENDVEDTAAEDTDDGDGVEAAAGASLKHELHPIHGQWRFVGALDDMM